MYTDQQFWIDVRQALLMLVDALERKLGVEPRTADLRKAWKRGIISGKWLEEQPPDKSQ